MSARTGRTTGIGIPADGAHESAGWEADKKGGDVCGGGTKGAGPAPEAGRHDGCCCIPCNGNGCCNGVCCTGGLYALRVAIVCHCYAGSMRSSVLPLARSRLTSKRVQRQQHIPCTTQPPHLSIQSRAIRTLPPPRFPALRPPLPCSASASLCPSAESIRWKKTADHRGPLGTRHTQQRTGAESNEQRTRSKREHSFCRDRCLISSRAAFECAGYEEAPAFPVGFR
jgi:hypothetical protein